MARELIKEIEMNVLNYMKLPFSFRAGWDNLSTAHPAILKTFLLLTLPLSLLPPLMLVYAGSHHASQYLMDAPLAQWKLVAFAFLIVELLTVPLMAWLIKNIAAVHNIAADFKDTFLIAALSAIPMWLSALGLAIPHLWAMIGIIVLGFFAAANLLYRGIYSILKMTEQMEAQSVAYEAFATGGVLWVILCALVVLPLMN